MPLCVYRAAQNSFSILFVENSTIPDIEPITISINNSQREEDTVELLVASLEKMRDEKKCVFLCGVSYYAVKDVTEYLLLFYKSEQYKYDYNVTPIHCAPTETEQSFEDALSHSMFSHEVTEGHKIIAALKGNMPRQLFLVQARNII